MKNLRLSPVRKAHLNLPSLPMLPASLPHQIYDAEQVVFRELGQFAEQLIKQCLAKKSLNVHSVTHRCKEKTSLARKLSNPHKNYQARNGDWTGASRQFTGFPARVLMGFRVACDPPAIRPAPASAGAHCKKAAVNRRF